MSKKGGLAGANLCNQKPKQPANWQEIVGKTIQSISTTMGINVVKLNFTDGTSIVIDTEAVGLGLYAPVALPVKQYDKNAQQN